MNKCCKDKDKEISKLEKEIDKQITIGVSKNVETMNLWRR